MLMAVISLYTKLGMNKKCEFSSGVGDVSALQFSNFLSMVPIDGLVENYVANNERAPNNNVLRISSYYFVIHSKCINTSLNIKGDS